MLFTVNEFSSENAFRLHSYHCMPLLTSQMKKFCVQPSVSVMIKKERKKEEERRRRKKKKEERTLDVVRVGVARYPHC